MTNFDDMFDEIKNINWKSYFKKDFPILVKTSSVRSELFSARTIQSL
ncbi:MAG: hypothetical protein P1U46_00510 [Patescibacteria group bacterium]|nr:hypothetical protein [Patescibacteria group bacterium]